MIDGAVLLLSLSTPFFFQQCAVLLDLQTCADNGASTVRDVCPYPNSFHIDVWVAKEGKEGSARQSASKHEFEKLR